MKSGKVIELLKKLDPSGETEVLVGNQDIHFIDSVPAYYDGLMQLHIRDEKQKGYNIKGVRFCNQGNKIRINTLGYKDIFFEDHNSIVETDSTVDKEKINRLIEEVKIDSKNLDLEVNNSGVLNLERIKSLNIIADYICPECSKQDVFFIKTKVKILLSQDGYKLDGDIQPDNDDIIKCTNCEHIGFVKDFKKRT